MQSAEVGHFSLNINNKTFSLVASLRNMARLAGPVELLDIFGVLHDRFISDYVRISVARDVLLACADSDLIDAHLIKCTNRKPHLSNKKISINDQVMVAAALMRHGIAGVNRPENGLKKLSRPMEKFNAYEFVAEAKNHFGMSMDEAWNLTMTEFSYHLASHFPPESSKQDTPSLDDHKAAMRALMEKNNNGK